MKHGNYKKVLFEKKEMVHSMNTIRRDKHQLSSYRITKTSLSCFDDKRYILNDGVEPLPYGHWGIAEIKKRESQGGATDHLALRAHGGCEYHPSV